MIRRKRGRSEVCRYITQNAIPSVSGAPNHKREERSGKLERMSDVVLTTHEQEEQATDFALWRNLCFFQLWKKRIERQERKYRTKVWRLKMPWNNSVFELLSTYIAESFGILENACSCSKSQAPLALARLIVFFACRNYIHSPFICNPELFSHTKFLQNCSVAVCWYSARVCLWNIVISHPFF